MRTSLPAFAAAAPLTSTPVSLRSSVSSMRPSPAAATVRRARLPPSASAAPATTGLTPRLTDPAAFLAGVKVLICDCDGVIWLGPTLIDGVADTIAHLRGLDKRVFFVTNNSTKSRAGYLKKFTGLGLEADAEEIFSSSFAAAAYLEQIDFKKTGKKVYVIGEVGICEELDKIGVPWVGGPDDSEKVPDMGTGGKVDHDHDVGAVVVGFDRFINYWKIQNAQLCINENEDCLFIATNLDAVTHLTDVQEWAGNGSMVGAIKGCTGQEPILVGKPSPLMIDYIVSKFGIDRSEICMIGDRLDTDVAFGVNNGLSSILVLSGVTSEEKLQSPENKIRPDYFIDSIADLYKS